MVDVLIRKKLLKIQERLGMRIGIVGGTQKMPAPRTRQEVIDVLLDLYKIGIKAYVLPNEFFADIPDTQSIYKVKYGDLLKIKEEAKRYNIELSVRVENLTTQPDQALDLYSRICSIMDARNFIIQPNFYSSIMPPSQALKLAVYKINEIVNSTGVRIKMGIETTGKTNDVGSLEDVIDICKRTQCTEPVINWAHIHARSAGGLRTRRDFAAIISEIRDGLGMAPIKDSYHIFSGISYGPSGEIKHMPLDSSDLNLEFMIREAMSMGSKGTLIFEDPDKEGFVLKWMDRLADMVR
ncbi:MAG: hypothetical protein ABIH90_02390 [Candidatus Aenigmatarchaeota archaeon]